MQIPTHQQYINALTNIEENTNEKQKNMLKFHYNAHNKTVTFGELAESVGYPNYNTANLHYGKLGKMLGKELNITFDTMSEANKKPFYCSSIGSGNINKLEEQEFQLVMHHELAKALDRIAWF